MSLDESSFDSSTVLVVEVLLLEGEFQFVVLMCADFPAAIARTVLNIAKNHNNSTHYREIKNYISHSEQRLEILVWEKKVVLIICVNYVDKRIQPRQRTIQ